MVLKRARKRAFLDNKWAIDRASRFETARCLFVVMHLCFSVVLSYLDAGFEPRCGRKDFWTTCCCCSRLELGRSWVLLLRNALEITGEETPLPLEMCVDGDDDRPETQLKNGSFPPQHGPLCGTTAWYMPY